MDLNDDDGWKEECKREATLLTYSWCDGTRSRTYHPLLQREKYSSARQTPLRDASDSDEVGKINT